MKKMSLSTTQLSFPDTITMDTPTFSNIATMDTGPLSITDDLHTAYQSAVDIQCIQFQLDCHVKDLSAQWKASIPFLCSVTYDNTSFTDIPPSVPLSLIDISDYLGGQKYPARRLSFCPTTYPPPTLDEEMTSRKSPCWCDLSRALGTAAHEAGNPIILNGSQKSR
jgi:hypothetical protein